MGFYRNDFHLKSSFDKTKYIFDQSIWECNGHFDHWFSNTKALSVSGHSVRCYVCLGILASLTNTYQLA